MIRAVDCRRVVDRGRVKSVHIVGVGVGLDVSNQAVEVLVPFVGVFIPSGDARREMREG